MRPQSPVVARRLRAARRFLIAVVVLWAGGPAWGQPFEWQQATPESQGLSSEKLDRLERSLASRNTKAFLVVRNDRIVHEWYADGHGATKPHYTASMAKAIVGGLSLGIALTDGRIGLDEKAARYIPHWNDDARKSNITIRQLGSHTSGLEDAEADGLPHDELTGWKGDFWKRLAPPNDTFTLSRDRTPVLFEPGERFQYSNPGMAMLAYAVTAALRDAPQRDLRTLLRDRAMRLIGVPDEEWSVGYGQTHTVDGLPLVACWGGGGYTARAVARVGRLMLREGDWQGKRILGKEAVRRITTDAGTPGHGGMGWWSNNSGRYAGVPTDAFWGSGAGHQVVLVIPSLNLVAVRNGGNLGPREEEHHDALNAHLFGPLLDTITADAPGQSVAPYAPSPVIARLDWAEKATIIRRAKGSDNWPLTWADDDHLYTAYGDGHGFDPGTPEKLSLNFGRNYAGARDDFVYVYSHDHDTAYQPADRMVLARVPKGRIRERGAYAFFKGFGPKREPEWTREVGERGAVFTHPGKCYRSGISYNAALERYLWSQTLPGADPRFGGGFGIYDAPEPWGPWTTVFYTEAWDVGPGETSSFPTKWMSADGETLYLVFSGDDYFAVRKARLTLLKPQ